MNGNSSISMCHSRVTKKGNFKYHTTLYTSHLFNNDVNDDIVVLDKNLIPFFIHSKQKNSRTEVHFYKAILK